MSQHLELLTQARQAIEAFRPDDAAQMLGRFEAAIVENPPLPSERKRIATELNRIIDLSGAARDGVASAREQLRELMRLARGLDIYDRDGARTQRNTPGTVIGRF